MREVLWIGKGKPDTMTPIMYEASVNALNNHIRGEVVKFGTDNFMIIGDNLSKAKFEALKKSGQ